MIATTVKQSKKFMDLGVDSKNADMCYVCICMAGEKIDIPEEAQYSLSLTPFGFFSGIGLPAWSVDALLKMLPTSISNDYVGDKSGKDFYLFIDRDKHMDGVIRFEVFYADMDLNVIEQYCDEELVNAVFKMIIRLKELKKI